ncbi:MAG: DMT family transporter [Rhodobacteraceae bacterium]|nr:DMT family transporter [Paracoccaceae bacterium]
MPPAGTATPDRRLQANALCAASMMVWAAGLPAADLLIPHVPAVWLSLMRNVLAAGLLLPLWWAFEGGRRMLRAPWLLGAALGWITLGLASILTIIAQDLTDAVTVAVFSASSPVVGLAIEVVAGRRRISAAVLAGLVLTLAGGLMASAAGALTAVTLGIGALAAFAAVVCYTLGSSLTVTALPGQSDIGRAALTIAGAAAIGAGLTLAWHLGGGAGPDWAALGRAEFGALLVYGVGAIGISQLLWIMGVSRFGIGMASFHLNAAPFYVMLILFALGEPWNWTQAAGAAVVALGVLIAQDRR